MSVATAAQWSEWVQAWRASGQTANAFAESKGFSGKTLRWWACELRRRKQQAPARASSEPTRFARVLRAPEPSASTTRAAPESIRVEVGAVAILVRRGFDPALLREVVAALGGAR